MYVKFLTFLQRPFGKTTISHWSHEKSLYPEVLKLLARFEPQLFKHTPKESKTRFVKNGTIQNNLLTRHFYATAASSLQQKPGQRQKPNKQYISDFGSCHPTPESDDSCILNSGLWQIVGNPPRSVVCSQKTSRMEYLFVWQHGGLLKIPLLPLVFCLSPFFFIGRKCLCVVLEWKW